MPVNTGRKRQPRRTAEALFFTAGAQLLEALFNRGTSGYSVTSPFTTAAAPCRDLRPRSASRSQSVTRSAVRDCPARRDFRSASSAARASLRSISRDSAPQSHLRVVRCRSPASASSLDAWSGRPAPLGIACVVEPGQQQPFGVRGIAASDTDAAGVRVHQFPAALARWNRGTPGENADRR